MFEPSIYIDPMTELQQMGVRITIGGGLAFVDISVDKFYEIYYHIHTIDMYNCAIGMLNFIGRNQMPQQVKEYNSFNSVMIEEQQEPEIKIKDRQPPTTGRSFFDRNNKKLDSLDNL